MPFRRALLAATVAILPLCSTAHAVEFDGVDLPETTQVGGATLQLNGYGLRTYSLLRIHVYVAALYLEHPSTDPQQIIGSPETRLLIVRFMRDVTADEARGAWREGLHNNCQLPCRLDRDDVEHFLAQVPAMRAGDTFNLVFSQQGAVVSVNGRRIGVISHPGLATAMLAAFIGPNPASPGLKRELLQGHG